MIDGETQLVGAIGWPIAHSLSPAMHNAAFQALGLNWCYVPLPVRPGQVEAALRGLVALGFRGANVTVPHKQAVIPYLDAVSDDARAIGAVNTLVVKDGRLLGDNTDATGFLVDLRRAGFEPVGRRALVLGAGGGARAVAYALAMAGTDVVVLNRTPSRAETLVRDLAAWVPPVSLRSVPLSRQALSRLAPTADLIVNATSVGMWPDVDTSPWPDDLPIPPGCTVYDLVYRPARTRLLRQAEACGAQGIGGLGMLVHQGALAFEMWTGQDAPVGVMRQQVDGATR